MKTLLNDLVAVILAAVFSTSIINSNTILLVSKNTRDIYAAVNSETYKVTSQAFQAVQPVYF